MSIKIIRRQIFCLSEVGMLPAELMGLNERNLRQLNNLIKNKNFINHLVKKCQLTLYLIKEEKI